MDWIKLEGSKPILPQEHKKVLVTFISAKDNETKCVGIAYYNLDSWYWDFDDSPVEVNITHWTTLPEPALERLIVLDESKQPSKEELNYESNVVKPVFLKQKGFDADSCKKCDFCSWQLDAAGDEKEYYCKRYRQIVEEDGYCNGYRSWMF